MAEEGPGARRLSPHNKDPSLVTSYLPPNLQKAPCHPSKAPAPAACAAAGRKGRGVGTVPLLCPPTCPLLPGPPAPRMRSEARPQQLGAFGAAGRCSPRKVGRGDPRVAPLHPDLSFQLPAPRPRFILPVAILPAAHPGATPSPHPGPGLFSEAFTTCSCPAAGSPLPAVPGPSNRARRGGHSAFPTPPPPRGCPGRRRRGGPADH